MSLLAPPIAHSKSSGLLLQGPHGDQGNFEVVIPRVGGGIWHLWRDNDQLPPFPWKGPNLAFGSTLDVHAAALVFSSYRNLEVVTTEGDRLHHHWRDDSGGFRWQSSTQLPGATGIVGSPGFTQSSFGQIGNFEVVAPVRGGGLGHWWRDNDHGLAWNRAASFGGTDVFDAAVIIQSTFGPSGHLEVVARAGDRLLHLWSGSPGIWSDATVIANGISGSPALIQGAAGGMGNFEVVTPLAAGGLAHFWRDNDRPDHPWHPGPRFGSGQVLAVGLVQGSFGAHGNLEAVGWLGDRLVHHWRDETTSTWSPPRLFHQAPAYEPQTRGEARVEYDTGVVAIHSHLLRTGRVLFFAFSDTDDTMGETRVLDLGSGLLSQPASTPDLFCSGHQFLPDGRLLVAGGHHMDIQSIGAFDADAQSWTPLGTMSHGRWYPTCVALEDGRVLVISGTVTGAPVSGVASVNNTIQVFDPMTNVMGPEQAIPTPFSRFDPTGFGPVDLYPWCFLLPDSGQVLVHSRETSRFYDPGSGAWADTQLRAAHSYSRTYPGQGCAVLLPLLPSSNYRARVMAVGGGGAVIDPFQLREDTPATATAEILDLGAPSPAWRFTASMANARVMADAVLLPDGTVLVIGGSSTGRANAGTNPVLPLELFDPATETWTTLASKNVPASYHSTALLLPDGRVLMAGKDGLFNAPPYDYPEHRGEVFSPPYLFRGPRPIITEAPATVGYGESFEVRTPEAAAITSVALIRCSSVTHSVNMGQRFVGLEIASRGAGSLVLKSPPNGRVAPPGHHLLFVLDAAGVPSVAAMVHLGP